MRPLFLSVLAGVLAVLPIAASARLLCQSDQDCGGSTPACQPDGSCGQCSATNTSLCTGAQSVCNTSTGTCVGCVSNHDCFGTTPLCDQTSSTCVACTQEAGCGGATPACQPNGSCGQCSATNTTQCTGQMPTCDVAVGACGCTADSQCGTPDSGFICSGMPGMCITGCFMASGRNGCPAGQYCTDQTGAQGFCLQEPCEADSDCSAPLGRCETTVEPHTCVHCLADSDCGMSTVCNSDHLCVQCTSSDTSACSAMVTGSACLANGTCGCKADSDCGGSGRVCDPGSSKCMAAPMPQDGGMSTDGGMAASHSSGCASAGGDTVGLLGVLAILMVAAKRRDRCAA